MRFRFVNVLSRNNFLSAKFKQISLTLPEMARKLNKRKVRWIVRQVDKQQLSIRRIGRIQNISTRWVREIYRKYRGKNLYKDIKFKKSGRKPKPLLETEINLIKKIYSQYFVGAVNIEKILRSMQISISHNRIHKVLLKESLSKTEPKKSKRRKWIRYERKHSNSLWHTDWFEIDGKQAIAFEDDASRFISGFGVFSNATARNAATVLEQAVNQYGKPKQLITDHGTQFISLSREDCENPEPNEFQKKMQELGIEHIKARVKHPQTNGKVERLFQTLMKGYRHFKSWDKVIKLYNFVKPHMSLEKEDGTLVTPYESFLEKKR